MATSPESPFSKFEGHCGRVQDVVDQVKTHNAKPTLRPMSVKKKAKGHTTHGIGFKDKCDRVDVDPLNKVLSIDAAAGLAVVEGQVTMGQLTRATMEFGMLPRVVPEYPSFTMAGLVNGMGIQSSSHKWGLFTDVLAGVEVVIGDGSVVYATMTNEHRDLFLAIMGCYGSLGFVVGVVVELMPVKPLVKTTYHWLSDVESFGTKLRELAEKPDFLEGIVFGKDKYVVIEGNMVEDGEDLPEFHPGIGIDSAVGEEWYYQYVRQTPARGISQDVIPVLEYVHRSARGAYWMVEMFLDLTFLAKSRTIRTAADKDFIHMIEQYGFTPAGLSAAEMDRCTVNQDMGVRLSEVEDYITFVLKTVNVTPLWICPIKQTSALEAVNDSSEMLCDVGIYGEPKVSGFRHKRDVRALQRKAFRPSTWGVLHLSEQEFRERCPLMEVLDKARAKYHAEGRFLSLRDKVTLEQGDDDGKPPIPMWRLVNAYKISKTRGLVLTAMLVGIPALLGVGGYQAVQAGRRGDLRRWGSSLVSAVKGVVKSVAGAVTGSTATSR